VTTVLKSGSLKLLETYGPVQGCNGIALPLTLLTYIIIGDAFCDVNLDVGEVFGIFIIA
jgi:hypothetical protein